jgi:hypothetical protein
MAHDGILRFIAEKKATEAASKIEAVVESLKVLCPDLDAQEKMDLMSTIFDLEDIQSRLQSIPSDAPAS